MRLTPEDNSAGGKRGRREDSAPPGGVAPTKKRYGGTQKFQALLVFHTFRVMKTLKVGLVKSNKAERSQATLEVSLFYVGWDMCYGDQSKVRERQECSERMGMGVQGGQGKPP